MTREELKTHCEKQIENCEMWALWKGEEPHGKVYEEHKLILELLEQETVSKEVYDHEYFLRKDLDFKLAKLEHDKNEVLDKIRAEIKALSPEPTAYDVVDGNPVKDAVWETLIEVDKIIDKYKADRSEEDGNDRA